MPAILPHPDDYNVPDSDEMLLLMDAYGVTPTDFSHETREQIRSMRAQDTTPFLSSVGRFIVELDDLTDDWVFERYYVPTLEEIRLMARICGVGSKELSERAGRDPQWFSSVENRRGDISSENARNVVAVLGEEYDDADIDIPHVSGTRLRQMAAQDNENDRHTRAHGQEQENGQE